MEVDTVNKEVHVTAKWIREDDGDDSEQIEKSAARNWYIMEEYYRDLDYNILDNGKDFREDYSKDVFAQNRVPMSAVQFPIWDADRMAGVFTFENWEKREWNTAETATLFCITRMISSHLLQRQVREELETEITVGELIDTIEYDYPTFHLSMDCFWAEIVSGDLVLKEHEAAKWLTCDELDSVEWLPADITLIEKIQKELIKAEILEYTQEEV